MPWRFDENMDVRVVIKFRLRKLVPVVNKDDPLCLNAVYLSLNKPTVFGRILTDEVKVRLLSKSTPLMISRKHATITFEEGLWTVTDHKSVNGVSVNGQRIEPEQKHPIHVGDRITFGCAFRSDLPPEFEYCFEAVSTSRTRRASGGSVCNEADSPSKRVRVSIERNPMLRSSLPPTSNQQIKEQESKICRLAEELKAKEDFQNELLNRLETTEQGLMERLEEQRRTLQTERSEAESKLKELLESQLREKESMLKREYDEQLAILERERERVEKSLQDELSKKLSEKDQSYQKDLEDHKNALDKALLDKERERSRLLEELQLKEGMLEQYKTVEEDRKQLETCLDELRRQILEKDDQLAKQKEVTKQVEMDTRQTVISAMEDEFTCIICQELFINATILPCAHTFCEVCILGWTKKKRNCPVCRRKIRGKAVRSFALDSAVEKVVASLDHELTQRRETLKRDREDQMRREIAAGNQDSEFIHKPGEGDNEEDDEHDNANDSRPGPSRLHVVHRRQRSRSRSRSPRSYRHNYHQHRGHSTPSNSGNNVTANSTGYYSNQNLRPYSQNQLQQAQQQHTNMSTVRGFGFPSGYSTARHQYDLPPPLHHQQHQRYQHAQGGESFGYQTGFSQRLQMGCFNCGDASHIARNCPRR